MTHTRTILSGIIGVIFMTLFSGVLSRYSKTEFIEHRVLSKLLRKLGFSKFMSDTIAIKSHLMTGIGFNYVNKFLIDKKIVVPSFRSAVTTGFFEGLAGVLIWSVVFKFHPNPPKMNLKAYFTQLVFAHIVFGVFTILSVKK